MPTRKRQSPLGFARNVYQNLPQMVQVYLVQPGTLFKEPRIC